jgi:hypothetical protein
VKILQALRNKNVPSSAGQIQKKTEELKQTNPIPPKVSSVPQPPQKLETVDLK